MGDCGDNPDNASVARNPDTEKVSTVQFAGRAVETPRHLGAVVESACELAVRSLRMGYRRGASAHRCCFHQTLA